MPELIEIYMRLLVGYVKINLYVNKLEDRKLAVAAYARASGLMPRANSGMDQMLYKRFVPCDVAPRPSPPRPLRPPPAIAPAATHAPTYRLGSFGWVGTVSRTTWSSLTTRSRGCRPSLKSTAHGTATALVLDLAPLREAWPLPLTSCGCPWWWVRPCPHRVGEVLAQLKPWVDAAVMPVNQLRQEGLLNIIHIPLDIKKPSSEDRVC